MNCEAFSIREHGRSPQDPRELQRESWKGEQRRWILPALHGYLMLHPLYFQNSRLEGKI